MIFDTDVFIWVQRGNEKGISIFENTVERYISIQTYMELLQGAIDKKQHRDIKKFLSIFNFKTLPFSEKIGDRAAAYIEDYALSHKLYAGDAIIAATAIEYNMKLCSGNKKHFKPIKELEFTHFKPF